jgi:hypothetical protein
MPFGDCTALALDCFFTCDMTTCRYTSGVRRFSMGISMGRSGMTRDMHTASL